MENIFLFYYFFLLIHFNFMKFFSDMPFYLSVHATAASTSSSPVKFPTMPKLKSQSIDEYIIQIFVYIGSILLYPVEYILYGIGDGLGSGITGLFSSLFGLASTTYNNRVHLFAFAGPLAPILVSVVWGISLVIVIFFILMAIHLIWGDIQDDTGD
jgi:hypothetical protein